MRILPKTAAVGALCEPCSPAQCQLFFIVNHEYIYMSKLQDDDDGDDDGDSSCLYTILATTYLV